MTEIIGANMYGSDTMFKSIQAGALTDKYNEIRSRYTLIGILGTTVEPRFGLDRVTTLRFYQDTIHLCHEHKAGFCIVKPKDDSLTEDLRDLVSRYDRAVLEEDLNTYALLPVLDIVICIDHSSVGLEALMMGKKVIYYDPNNLGIHLYSAYHPLLVAFSREELDIIVSCILERGSWIDEPVLREIRERHGFRFDGRIVDRFRQMVVRLQGQEPGNHTGPV